MDCGLPSSSVHGIFQTRTLEWVAPGDLPDPGIEPICLVSFALAGGFFTTSATCKAPHVFRWDTLTLILYISLLK